MRHDDLDSRPEKISRLATLLRDVAAGTVARAEVTAYTRELWSGGGQGSPFGGNGPAAVVFDSVWNIEDTLGGELVLRDSDLIQLARWLREGLPSFNPRRLTSVLGRCPELAHALDVPTVRYFLQT